MLSCVFSTAMFGVSDHDLMFEIRAKSAIEADDGDENDENDARFINNKVFQLSGVFFLNLSFYMASCKYI